MSATAFIQNEITAHTRGFPKRLRIRARRSLSYFTTTIRADAAQFIRRDLKFPHDSAISNRERRACDLRFASDSIAAGKLVLPKFDGGLPDTLKKIDLDGDGKLNADELAAVQADIASGKLVLPGVPHTPPPLPDFLNPYDVNGNGILEPSEIEPIRADIASGQLVPPVKPPTTEPGTNPPTPKH